MEKEMETKSHLSTDKINSNKNAYCLSEEGKLI